MLCAETAESLGHATWAERVRIDATDIDRESLERSTAARYLHAAFLEAPAWMTARYCEPTNDGWQVRDAIRRMVTVRRLDLARETRPAASCDLILCRNVVIYFDRPTQERLFGQFAEALTPGGLLVLGKVETLLGSRARAAHPGRRPRAHLPAGRMKPGEIMVHVAEYKVGGAGDTLITVGLGSCVAVALHDADAKIGGLAHILLPSPALSRRDPNPGKFPQTAIPLLLQDMTGRGARASRITARLAGRRVHVHEPAAGRDHPDGGAQSRRGAGRTHPSRHPARRAARSGAISGGPSASSSTTGALRSPRSARE